MAENGEWPTHEECDKRIAALEAELELERLRVDAWHGNSDDWQAENTEAEECIAYLNDAALELENRIAALEDERDALRGSFEAMSREWHRVARHGGAWELCDGLCHGHRAVLKEAKCPARRTDSS
jgi:chromosome segregation ATPase